ncbi:MAG: M48 family metalloprotease [Candidatus Aminicenantales bacterium]
MNARSRVISGGWLAVLLTVLFVAPVQGQLLNKLKQLEQALEKGKKVVQAVQTVRGVFGDFSEEEEYYIGRSVAALILGRYKPLNDPSLNRYVNDVGNAVAIFSDRPEIYAGWHFQVLDTEEVNALAAPGGMIFVTKGLIRRCPDEESLALVLAHEVGHVAARHGLQSIKKANLTKAFTSIGIGAIQKYGPAELAQVTSAFEGVLGDIVETLIERGYDRKFEYEADAAAVLTGCRTGYDPTGISRFLRTMIGDGSPAAGKGWFKTHPSPEKRIKETDAEIAELRPVPPINAVRTKRFTSAAASIW